MRLLTGGIAAIYRGEVQARAEADERPRSRRPTGYFHWSREPAMGLFSVLPLWIVLHGDALDS